jgi:hypothetical protein
MRAAPVLAALAVGWPLEAQTLRYEGSAGFATGSYIFTMRTSSWHVSTGLALDAGPVTLRAAFPVFYQNSPLVATTGSGLVPTGGSSGGAVADSAARRSGNGSRRTSLAAAAVFPALSSTAGDPIEVPTTAAGEYDWAAGDPVVGLTLAVLRTARFGLVLGASTKVPVTDTARFGTGAWDFGTTVSSSIALGARVLAGVDLGYWVTGDTPELDLANPLLGGVTLSYLMPGGWSLAAGVNAGTPVIDGFASSVTATASVLLPSRTGLGVLLATGFTETAPDVSCALTWRFGLLR